MPGIEKLKLKQDLGNENLKINIQREIEMKFWTKEGKELSLRNVRNWRPWKQCPFNEKKEKYLH